MGKNGQISQKEVGGQPGKRMHSMSLNQSHLIFVSSNHIKGLCVSFKLYIIEDRG